ncbi:hypothetical protein, partial [Pseudomonas putida]|uniref:hypothetical protein n=2 Tax=Pseudomonas TaxID=286 RepID=UPI001C0C582B
PESRERPRPAGLSAERHPECGQSPSPDHTLQRNRKQPSALGRVIRPESGEREIGSAMVQLN